MWNAAQISRPSLAPPTIRNRPQASRPSTSASRAPDFSRRTTGCSIPGPDRVLIRGSAMVWVAAAASGRPAGRAGFSGGPAGDGAARAPVPGGAASIGRDGGAILRAARPDTVGAAARARFGVAGLAGSASAPLLRAGGFGGAGTGWICFPSMSRRESDQQRAVLAPPEHVRRASPQNGLLRPPPIRLPRKSRRSPAAVPITSRETSCRRSRSIAAIPARSAATSASPGGIARVATSARSSAKSPPAASRRYPTDDSRGRITPAPGSDRVRSVARGPDIAGR